jgi:hypothetical protein
MEDMYSLVTVCVNVCWRLRCEYRLQGTCSQICWLLYFPAHRVDRSLQWPKELIDVPNLG